MMAILSGGELAAQLEALASLKPFPQVALRLMRLCERSDTPIGDITEALKCDPGLSLRMLQLANSSVYGYGGSVRSIEQAVVVLGFRTIKNLALAAATCDVFRDGTEAPAPRAALWRHSLACGAVARLLALQSNSTDPEEAFTAGLLHDVGKLIFLDLLGDDYRMASTTGTHGLTVSDEQRMFGASHDQIGWQCSTQWSLPAPLRDSVAWHHAPLVAKEYHELVAVVSLANQLVHHWGLGTAADPQHSSVVTPMPVESAIHAELLPELQQSARDEFESLATSFIL